MFYRCLQAMVIVKDSEIHEHKQQLFSDHDTILIKYRNHSFFMGLMSQSTIVMMNPYKSDQKIIHNYVFTKH